MSSMDIIKARMEESVRLHKTLFQDETFRQSICAVAEECIRAIKDGRKIMVCGNGGSASDAQHMAGELVGRFQMDRKGIAAIALNTDTSVMTAWANDYSYEGIYARQVEALGNEGDVLIGISTSGNSGNVVQAFETADHLRIKKIAFAGKDGGRLKSMADIAIVVPSQ